MRSASRYLSIPIVKAFVIVKSERYITTAAKSDELNDKVTQVESRTECGKAKIDLQILLETLYKSDKHASHVICGTLPESFKVKWCLFIFMTL
jgi:CRISPR/Cas system-associated protein Csm6